MEMGWQFIEYLRQIPGAVWWMLYGMSCAVFAGVFWEWFGMSEGLDGISEDKTLSGDQKCGRAVLALFLYFSASAAWWLILLIWMGRMVYLDIPKIFASHSDSDATVEATKPDKY